MPKADMDQIITSPSAEIFLRMVTKGFYDNSYTALWIFEVIGREWDDMRAWAEGLKQEIHPQTCTWTIPIWEWIYGFEPDDSMTLEQRRQRIMAKVVGVRPINPEIVRKGVSTLTGIPEECVEVVDPVGPYRFEIVFKDLEDSISGKQVRRYVYTIKPSHLSVDLAQIFAYVFDHSKLEIMQVPAVRFHLGMDFWDTRKHNGRFFHDGSILHRIWRRYSIAIAVDYGLGALLTQMRLAVPMIHFHTSWSASERIASNGAEYQIGMLYWYDYDQNDPLKILIYDGNHVHGGGVYHNGSFIRDGTRDRTRELFLRQQKRRYGIGIAMGSGWQVRTPEDMRVDTLRLETSLIIKEAARTATAFAAAMRFWDVAHYDGTGLHDGTHLHGIRRWRARTEVGFTARMRFWDPWLHSGGHLHDGASFHRLHAGYGLRTWTDQMLAMRTRMSGKLTTGFCAGMSSGSGEIGVSILTRTRERYFHNGGYRRDGAARHRTISRKEIVA